MIKRMTSILLKARKRSLNLFFSTEDILHTKKETRLMLLHSILSKKNMVEVMINLIENSFID